MPLSFKIRETRQQKWMQIHESVRTIVLCRIWKIWAQMSISTSDIRLWRNKALPRFIYPVLDRGYRLWNMMIVSTLNSRERERERERKHWLSYHLVRIPSLYQVLPEANLPLGTNHHILVVFSALTCWCEVFLPNRQESRRKSFLEPSIWVLLLQLLH